jgi:hypothetical protein
MADLQDDNSGLKVIDCSELPGSMMTISFSSKRKSCSFHPKLVQVASVGAYFDLLHPFYHDIPPSSDAGRRCPPRGFLDYNRCYLAMSNRQTRHFLAGATQLLEATFTHHILPQ